MQGDALRLLAHGAAVIQENHERIAVRLWEYAGRRHEVVRVFASKVHRDLDDS